MRTILFQLLTLALASATVTMNSNLLLHMTFDTLPASDESTYQRGIITYGNVTLVPGKFGNAVQVNPKSGDFSNAFYTGQFQVANQLSAMAWVQFADANMFGDHSKIMSSKNGYTDAGGFEVQYYQGVITFLAGGNGGGAGASTANSKTQTITPNTWYHIAVTANGGQANIYVNGIDVTASGAITPVKAFPGKDITVGSSCNGAKVNAGGQWHGLLDEVRLYDVALAPNVIQQIFQEDDSVPSAGTSKLTSGVEALCLADAVPQSTPSLQLIYKDIPTDAQGKQYIGHSNSYMTFSNTKTHTDAGSMSHTTGVLTLKNAGSSALQLVSAKIQDTSLFTLSGFNAQSLAPGATVDLTVTFVGQGSDKTVLRSYLDITTDDQANPTTRVTLAGVFMLENEGGNEIPLESILGAFGFSVHTGITWVDEGIEYLNHTQTSMDEVSSFLWRTVDSSLPFRLQTIAGFSPCCQGNPGVSVSAATGVNCAVQLKPGYTQTVWPIAGSGSAAVAACSIDPSNRFGLVQDGTWFSNTPLSNAGFKSMHFYPARDADGTLIPNTYVVGHDYSLPTGCGGKDGQANCDYQDNVFLISNVAPADHTSLDRSAVVAIPIEYSFSSVSSSGLSDSNGQPIGFTQYLPNSMDTSVSINSFQPSLITLNPSSNSLTVQAVSGSPFGDENKLVNALRVPINPNGKSFGASLTVDFNSLVSGLTVGLFVGSDQDNFYAVYYKDGMIYASAELMQVDQTQNQQNPVFPQFQTNSYSFGNLSLPTGLTNVTFIIGVDPSNRTITPAVSFDGNVPQYFGGMWVLPGRSESSGLGYSGRLLGFGTGAGPFAFASDASGSNAKVNFLQFGINTCSASTLPAAVSQGQTAISQQSSPITSPTGIDSNPQDGPGQSNSDSIGIQTSNNNGGSPSGSNTIASSSSRSGVVFSILLLSVALFI